MLKYLTLVLGLAGFVPVTPTRQAQPPRDHADFSGRWTVVNAASRPYLGSGLGVPRILEIDFTTPGVLTIEYVATEFTTIRSITLDGWATENSVAVTLAPGMLSRPPSITQSVSRATWLKDKLRIVTTLTLPYGGGKTRKVEVQDVLSLSPDGSLVVETQTSSGGGTMRSRFARAAAGPANDDARRATAAATAVPPVPAEEHEWLDGYRFGMTADEVRRVPICTGRDYETVYSEPARSSLMCRRFPFHDLLVQVQFGFDHNALQSISVQAFPTSAKDARLATEIVLSYLDVNGGDLKSLDLGSQPVTAAAIWDNLTHRPNSRFGESLTVTTTNTSWPVILTAQFSKESYRISLGILHSR